MEERKGKGIIRFWKPTMMGYEVPTVFGASAEALYSGSVGHASLEVEGIYMSLYPTGATIKDVLESSGSFHSLEQDREYGNESVTVEIDGLLVDRILLKFREYEQDKSTLYTFFSSTNKNAAKSTSSSSNPTSAAFASGTTNTAAKTTSSSSDATSATTKDEAREPYSFNCASLVWSLLVAGQVEDLKPSNIPSTGKSSALSPNDLYYYVLEIERMQKK